MTNSSWPPPKGEVADAEAILIQLPVQIAQIEQTLNQAKVHLAALSREASCLHEILTGTKAEEDRLPLTDLRAAQELRVELIKAALQSVAVSQAAAKYLQARERFLQARRAWNVRRGE